MTAVLLLGHDQYLSQEWHKQRREGISASEIAAVMGISPYDSPFSLWWRKFMAWDIEPSAEMRTGTFLEPAIADGFLEFFDATDNLALRFGGLFASEERPWQLASPDRLVYFSPTGECRYCDGAGVRVNPQTGDADVCGPCEGEGGPDEFISVLECKYVAYSWDGWGDDATDEIPVHYRAQVLWQMDVMEVGEAFVCALGPGGFRTYRIRRDEKDLTMMREAGRRFMDSLAEGQPPNVDGHAATLPMLRRVNNQIEDRKQEVPAVVASGWLRAKTFKALAEKVERRYAAEVRAFLGTAKTATCDGRVFAARSSDDKLMRKS